MFGTKFRPLNFNSVYGLDNVKALLRAIIKQEDYEYAYLFEGQFSTGKTTLGRIFARAILCENRNDDMSPCNECFSCREFLFERNPAYIEIDAANKGSKESIQDLLEKIKYETISSKTIILIDEAHEISNAGKDALLLQLEKENKNVIIIFCTTENDKMPEALKSRCAQFHLSLPPENLVFEKLKKICEIENISYDSNALDILVRASDRHYRDAEINLGMISKLGAVSEENVRKFISFYDREIVYLLSTLSYDISKSLKAADYLLSRMSVDKLYKFILGVLSDTMRKQMGFDFKNEEYSRMLSTLYQQYNNSIFEILDYLLTRQRLTDITVFYSDLLVIHYKFMKDQFSPKQISTPVSKEKISNKKEQSESDLDKNLKYINSRPPWEREDIVRRFKAEKLKKEGDERTTERVSEVWDSDESSDNASDIRAVFKNEISEKDFGAALRGSLDEGKI